MNNAFTLITVLFTFIIGSNIIEGFSGKLDTKTSIISVAVNLFFYVLIVLAVKGGF